MYLLLFVLVALPLSLILFHLYAFCGKKGRMTNKLPGPPCLPVIGNLHLLNVNLVRMAQLLDEWADRYYPVYRLWVGSKAVIHIRHPDDCETLLMSSKHLNKEFGYEHFYPWMKRGLLTSDAGKWHERRKILTPAFHFNILKKYLEITNEQGEALISNMMSQGNETEQDLLPFCSAHTLNIICESAMGVALDDKKNEELSVKYKDAVYKMGDFIIERMMRPYIRDWMVPFLPFMGKVYKETLKNLDSFSDKIIVERRKYHQSTEFQGFEDQLQNDSSENAYMGMKKKRLAMLDLLLLAEKDGSIDEEGIREEVATFVFEGHDTTAMAMLFTIMLLAENQDAQNRARNEVEGILDQVGGKPEMNDLQHFVYLERCIKESLRMFPSVPMIGRKMVEDLRFKNFMAPKGSHLVMHINHVHRDPEFWPEPEKFDPDRFLPERSQGRHPFAYLPFSAGFRNCIGQKFAMMELKSSIAQILYNFELHPVDFTHDVVIKSDVVLRPSHSVRTRFVKIDRK
ncbi:hypothetical protein QAD02_010839 [Eretmocerus hayati]|uniref:Uncharacterized protein n=1 Tax=Eretmocerus hayati TaxID=131215 RepID=A0ACC2NV26_9HYME|nr:hypothetical protein QAD02_010839 [Eretmocerus hayati]